MNWAEEFETNCEQVLSQTNRQIAQKNEYPYRGSRKGYAGIEEEIVSN